ncbi:hypothetical protein CYY_005311 [Polysphondylium violaceum]|uniref:Uncharacterized protein n=1 Tax=Polysphondylium violaceum TaxID=133409 RepID=A0A8J4US99_9MYCE|nr:hypothetical protein CYY_005311 [Polysphondylium violaceum]
MQNSKFKINTWETKTKSDDQTFKVPLPVNKSKRINNYNNNKKTCTTNKMIRVSKPITPFYFPRVMVQEFDLSKFKPQQQENKCKESVDIQLDITELKRLSETCLEILANSNNNFRPISPCAVVPSCTLVLPTPIEQSSSRVPSFSMDNIQPSIEIENPNSNVPSQLSTSQYCNIYLPSFSDYNSQRVPSSDLELPPLRDLF